MCSACAHAQHMVYSGTLLVTTSKYETRFKFITRESAGSYQQSEAVDAGRLTLCGLTFVYVYACVWEGHIFLGINMKKKVSDSELDLTTFYKSSESYPLCYCCQHPEFLTILM